MCLKLASSSSSSLYRTDALQPEALKRRTIRLVVRAASIGLPGKRPNLTGVLGGVLPTPGAAAAHAQSLALRVQRGQFGRSR